MRDYSPFERYRRVSQEYVLDNRERRIEKIRISYQSFLNDLTNCKIKIIDATKTSLEEKL